MTAPLFSTYPANFPCASREGHGAALSAGLVRTPMQAGNVRQRRTQRVLPQSIALSFIVPQDVLADWLTWVNAYAWDYWFTLALPGLVAGRAGTPTAPTLIRFSSDLSTELLQLRRLWYWRVRVTADYLPTSDELAPLGAWIVATTPDRAGALPFIRAGTPDATSWPDWVRAGSPVKPNAPDR